MINRMMPIGLVLGGLLMLDGQVQAAATQQIGNYANWSSVNWQPLTGLNDPDDNIAEQIDFVGDSNNPGAYWANTPSYLFFRVRVDVGTVTGTTFSDAHLILIDVVGLQYSGSNIATSKNLIAGNDGYPDYGFAWDSKSADPTKHGLEMVVRSTVNTVWNGINMDDIDYSAGDKLANDINGNSRTTDGYLQTVDSESTTNFGTTTFIDFAVSWNYLNAYTGLNSAQSWRIALGSIQNATDHNNLTGDIGGGANPPSLATSGWVTIATIPEPTALVLLLLSGGGLLVRRNRRRAA